MSEMGDMKFTTAGDMVGRPVLTMLVGVPGSGKSTWLKEQGFWDRTNLMILSTDNFIETVAAGEGKTYSEVFKDAIKLAEKHLDECLQIAIENDMDIVWDQTNLTRKTREIKLRRVPARYRKVAKVFLVPPQEEWHARLNSPERAGKNISDVILRSMAANFEQPTVDEGFDEVIVPVRF